MNIGTVREVKTHEYRVGLTPADTRAYASRGHAVYIEKGAGVPAGFEDGEYTAAGATLLDSAQAVFETCDMIVKVKEPQPPEIPLLRPGQILFTYLHLAASRELTVALMERQIKAVAYETIETPDGSLPCLTPMSQIAGRLAVQEGAKYLEKPYGGRGILLGGVPGVQRGRVGILGGGTVGANACKIAVGLGADVAILDVSAARLAYLEDIFGSRITTLYSSDHNIEQVLAESDVIIGAVLVHGARAPHMIKRSHLPLMKKGAVLVDVSVDQGGCAQTTHPTTHDDPIYVVDGIVHYAVTNMPGAVALSSTIALTSATLPYGLLIAQHGLEQAAVQNSALRKGINLYLGNCVYESIARDLELDHTPLDSILKETDRPY